MLLTAFTADASDLQASTDRAAVKAKAELCMHLHELHRGRPAGVKARIEEAIPHLKEKFFAFYEGERVSADYLNPDTFSTGQIGPLPNFEVAQVVGRNEMHGTIGADRFIVRGFSTANVADGQPIKSSEFFRVCETETYETVGGFSRTVYILEPADGKSLRVKPSRIYPWYDTKNKVLLTGEFRKLDGTKAVFSVAGSEEVVPLPKFAAGDRDLIRCLWDRYGSNAPDDEPPRD